MANCASYAEQAGCGGRERLLTQVVGIFALAKVVRLEWRGRRRTLNKTLDK
jgi:hypothetical protein